MIAQLFAVARIWAWVSLADAIARVALFLHLPPRLPDRVAQWCVRRAHRIVDRSYARWPDFTQLVSRDDSPFGG